MSPVFRLNAYKSLPITYFMAWRFGNYQFVKGGVLDNTKSGITRGEIEFASVGKIPFNLHGDMQGNLYGKAIRFANPEYDPNFVFEHCAGRESDAQKYMEGFAPRQQGYVGDISGQPYLYIEWYSEENDRCVIELDAKDYEIIR